MEHLEVGFELSLLSKMTRDEGVGILTFITEWESNFEKFKNLELKLVTLVDLIFYILAIWLKRTGILFLRTLMH